jgi:hypothetical protein
MSFNITPDFSESVELSTDPMPVGSYTVRITETEEKISKNNNPYLKAKFVVFGAEGDLAKFNNWPVYGNFMYAGKGAGMMKLLLKAIYGDNIPSVIGSDELLGKEVVISIKYELDQQGERSNWPSIKSVNALG